MNKHGLTKCKKNWNHNLLQAGQHKNAITATNFSALPHIKKKVICPGTFVSHLTPLRNTISGNKRSFQNIDLQ
jgi:hypothetical protein